MAQQASRELSARVLVVEDEWLIANEFSLCLEEAGYEVVGPAHSVAQALRLLEETRPDAALLDISLHGEKSYPIAERLAECATPFAFLTGYTNGEIADLCREHPCLQKPVTNEALLSVIDMLLEGQDNSRVC